MDARLFLKEQGNPGQSLANGEGGSGFALGAARKPAGDFGAGWVTRIAYPSRLAFVSHCGNLRGLCIHTLGRFA